MSCFVWNCEYIDHSLLTLNLPCTVILRRFEFVLWRLEWECYICQKYHENSFKSTNTKLLNKSSEIQVWSSSQYCIFNTIIGIIRKSVYLSLQWYPICHGNVPWNVQYSWIWVEVRKEILQIHLCHRAMNLLLFSS